MKLNLPAKITNVFDSNETSTILILIGNGDLYSLNLETDEFLRVAGNPTPYPKPSIRTSEISHEGRIISVCMSNGDFFMYQLDRVKSNLFTILTNPSKIKTANQKDPLAHFFFQNNLNTRTKDLSNKYPSNVGTSLLSAYQTEQSLKPLKPSSAALTVIDWDNISYKSFIPDEFQPVAILTSSEDPLLGHRNIVNVSRKGTESLSLFNKRLDYSRFQPAKFGKHSSTNQETWHQYQHPRIAAKMFQIGELYSRHLLRNPMPVPQK